MDIQKVRWDKGSMVRSRDYIFLYINGNENNQFGTGYFCTPQNSTSSYESAGFW
jgi:hypothetical protein